MLVFSKSSRKFDWLPSGVGAINLWSHSEPFFSSLFQPLLPLFIEFLVWDGHEQIWIFIRIKFSIIVPVLISFPIFEPFGAKFKNIFWFRLDDGGYKGRKDRVDLILEVDSIRVPFLGGKGRRWVWLFHNLEKVWNLKALKVVFMFQYKAVLSEMCIGRTPKIQIAWNLGML